MSQPSDRSSTREFLESVRTFRRERDRMEYEIEIDFRSRHVEIRRFTRTGTELLGAGRWIDDRIENRSVALAKSIFDWAEAELLRALGRSMR
jgi:hypothetical protein